jgi:hypothetical protein
MKTVIITASLATALFSCATRNDIQVEFVHAELIRIDTVFRYANNEQLLTWKTNEDIHYISYAPLRQAYQVGTRMAVMVRR